MSKKAKRTQYVSNTLPDYLLKIAKKADFCMWQHEAHKPEGATIDWSCQYDKEMKLYSEMLIKKVLKVVQTELDRNGLMTYDEVIDDVKKRFLIGFAKAQRQKEAQRIS